MTKVTVAEETPTHEDLRALLATVTAERDQLAQLALENEQWERELMIVQLQREPDATAVLKRLQNGLCKAARLARMVTVMSPGTDDLLQE